VNPPKTFSKNNIYAFGIVRYLLRSPSDCVASGGAHREDPANGGFRKCDERYVIRSKGFLCDVSFAESSVNQIVSASSSLLHKVDQVQYL